MKFLRPFFENAYYHCLHYIVNKRLHWFERLFWLFLIILSMIGVIFIVHQSVHTFESTKASIRVRTDYLDFATPFPAVFFCEKREIGGKVDAMLKELNFTLKVNNSIIEITNFVRAVTFIRPLDPDPKISCDNPEKEFCKFLLAYRDNLQIFVKHIRASCEEIFTFCTFNRKQFNCCKYFLPVDTFEGKCYALNSFNAVIENGLDVSLDEQHVRSNEKENRSYSIYKYLPFKLRHQTESKPANLSVEVAHSELYVWYMGNTNVPTKMYQKENQFYLKDFTEGRIVQTTEIYLRVQEVIPDSSVFQLDEERRKCKFWHENSTLKALKMYSNSACEIECLRRAQLDICGCVVHLLPNQNGLKEPLCGPSKIGCTAENPRIGQYLSRNCRCVSSCHLFDVFPIGKVSHKSGIRFQSQNSTKRINFIVKAPTVQYVKYAAQSSLDFIVSIGGAITLFIGCSFLSLGQIFYYFLLRPFSERCLV